MSIGFSPHHPRYLRQYRRPSEADSDKPAPQHSGSPETMLADGDQREGLPPATLFEAALLSDNRPLSPYEIAQRLSREWAPPASSFPLTDKTI